MESPTPSIRRRQVDIDKPLQIIWLKNDDIKKQAETLQEILQSGSTHKPLTTQAKLQNHNILEQQTCKISLKASMGEVKTPNVRSVSPLPEFSETKLFSRPVSYIHFYEPPYDFDKSNYQIDDQDDDFLSLWNHCLRKEPSLQINEDKLEDMFTMFENLTFQNRTTVTPSKSPEAIIDKEEHYKKDLLEVKASIDSSEFKFRSTRQDLQKLQKKFVNLRELSCEVCSQTKENAMGVVDNIYLRCLSCNAVCHRSCYYYSSSTVQLPKEDLEEPCISSNFVHTNWKCDKCSLEIDNEQEVITCALCYNSNGLMRSIMPEDRSFGSFAHLVCARWVEEIEPSSETNNGKINGIRHIPAFRWTSSHCKKCDDIGICIQCTASHCRHSYHPYCALISECFMDCSTNKFYCIKHTKEHYDKLENSLGCSTTLSIEQLLLLAPIVKAKSREQLKLPPEPHSVVFEALFYYWKCKRFRKKSFLISQLNRMLEEDQEIVDRPKRGKKTQRSEHESLERILSLRRDLEYARILLDMIRRRETKKHEWLLASKREFEIKLKRAVLASLEEGEETDYSSDTSNSNEIFSFPSTETEDEDEEDDEDDSSSFLPVPELHIEPQEQPVLRKRSRRRSTPQPNAKKQKSNT